MWGFEIARTRLRFRIQDWKVKTKNAFAKLKTRVEFSCEIDDFYFENEIFKDKVKESKVR